MVLVTEIPDCDICKASGVSALAYADTKLDIGPWANVCAMHFLALPMRRISVLDSGIGVTALMGWCRGKACREILARMIGWSCPAW
jgi:hypothetical protein